MGLWRSTAREPSTRTSFKSMRKSLAFASRGPPGGPLGAFLGGLAGGNLGPSWGSLGPPWRHLGAALGLFWPSRKRFEAVLEAILGHLGNLGGESLDSVVFMVPSEWPVGCAETPPGTVREGQQKVRWHANTLVTGTGGGGSKTPTANHRRPLPFGNAYSNVGPGPGHATGPCIPPAVVETLGGTLEGDEGEDEER